MDFKIMDVYDLLQDIVYLTDLETYEIVWMNQAGKNKIEEYSNNIKCHKLFYNSDEPCEQCNIDNLLSQNECNDVLKALAIEKGIKKENYKGKKSIVEIEGRKYALDIIYEESDLLQAFNKTESANKFYEILLSEISELKIDGNMSEKINHVLSVILDMFQARRASIIRFSKDFDIQVLSVKAEGVGDFYYNPVLKQGSSEDNEFSRRLKEDLYIFIDANEIAESYPEASKAMLKEGDKNFTLMTWNIDDFTFKLVIENSEVIIEDKKVYKLMYNYLYFMIRSFSYSKMLYRLSNIDALTNVYNRNKFNVDLQGIYSNVDSNIAILFFDLDRLKDINDKFGHKMGDRLIQASAKILRECFEDCNVYRMGGDEFVVVGLNTNFDKFSEQIERMRLRLKNGRIYASYGFKCEESNAVVTELMTIAEKEMYIYKRQHHEEYSYKDEREAVVDKLKKYIMDGYFYLVLQPKINPYTKEVVGAEALIRGRNKGEWQYPNDFIPIFEKSGCIDLIDFFMLEEACKFQRYVLDTYEYALPISVNIARTTFLLDSFEKYTVDVLEKYNVPSTLLHLEITERMNVSSQDILAHGMKLKKYGLQLEVDDFGSHFTNLGFLNKDVFSVVKIDRAIFNDLKVDSLTARLIEFVIEECHKRDIIVLAEGVETEEDLELIKKMYIDEVQGYYFDKPMEKEKYIEKYIQPKK